MKTELLVWLNKHKETQISEKEEAGLKKTNQEDKDEDEDDQDVKNLPG